MSNEDVAYGLALLTKALNRLALVEERRLAWEQEQCGLRERRLEQRKSRGKA